MSEEARKKFVATHPDLAARPFDITMQKFIHTLLKPSDGEPGNPNPQRLRDLLSQDRNFRADMFNWLEETIKCQLPKDNEVVTEPNGPLQRPLTECRSNDVRFEKPPLIQDYLDDSETFDDLYADHVTRLVKEYNWHEHRETCWKHIRNGEPRDDTTCRMRINGLTSGAYLRHSPISTSSASGAALCPRARISSTGIPLSHAPLTHVHVHIHVHVHAARPPLRHVAPAWLRRHHRRWPPSTFSRHTQKRARVSGPAYCDCIRVLFVSVLSRIALGCGAHAAPVQCNPRRPLLEATCTSPFFSPSQTQT
ncbi:hypothetical protein B0H14DRAFT_3687317 [Mycena olivaceomarginata]|nr:hypothetical protein B0H14DRAFT_3687317 [Mycena olivaceomarginata]